MKQYTTDQIRNIVLLGHGGSGKTTLTESMLFLAKQTSRMGRVEQGNTVSDFENQEVKKKCSIRTSLIPIEWKGYKINCLDTPGYYDFEGSRQEALAVADAAVIVIKGASGIEVGTERAWQQASSQELPKMIYITEMDQQMTNVESLLQACKDKFGKSIAPLQIPLYKNKEYAGYIHVVKQVARWFDGDNIIEEEVPDEYQEDLENVRTMVIESAVEADEELMEKYLEDEPISVEELQGALKQGVMTGDIVPVLCGAPVLCEGVITFMDRIVKSFPSPLEAGSVDKTQDKPSLFIFKTTVDPFIGRLNYFKVKTGQIAGDTVLMNPRTEESIKLAHLYTIQGKQQIEVKKLCAGDIGAVAKLKDVETNDTLTDKNLEILYEKIAFATPYVRMGVYPEGKGDEEKMSLAFAKLMAEDKTFYTEYDQATKQSVICGIGEQQLDIIVDMLKDKFKVSVTLRDAITCYKETIRGKMKVRGKYKKQSGGHGQYGDVVMEFEPSGDLEMPYVFEEKVFGGSVPKQYFPAVEKALVECTQGGVLAGYPVVGVKAILLDGSHHPVDSSEMAFKMATTMAFKDGMEKAKPILLEPIAHVEITVPENYTGDIISDMKKHRGRMMGMEIRDDKQVILAEVPMSEMYRYATQLRSLTQGRGELVYYFERYEEAPVDICEKVITSKRA